MIFVNLLCPILRICSHCSIGVTDKSGRKHFPCIARQCPVQITPHTICSSDDQPLPGKLVHLPRNGRHHQGLGEPGSRQGGAAGGQVGLQEQDKFQLGLLNCAPLAEVQEIGAEGDDEHGQDDLHFVVEVKAGRQLLDKVEVSRLKFRPGIAAWGGEKTAVHQRRGRRRLSTEVAWQVIFAALQLLLPD